MSKTRSSTKEEAETINKFIHSKSKIVNQETNSATRIRDLITKYEAENVLPNSCLAWKIAGLKEALEIINNDAD